ncbi:MAG: Clp protease N-terminal domain-containing protein, partial [Planctomycetota bacterium]
MPFQPDKLTVKAGEALQNAQHLAESRGHAQLLPLHLLKSLLEEQGGIVVPLFKAMNVDVGRLDSLVDSELGRLPKVTGQSQVAAGPYLMQVLETAQSEAALLSGHPSLS